MDFKSGIEDAIKNDNDISVRVESGTIVVDSDHDVAIDICDIHGLIVYSGAPATINGLGNGLTLHCPRCRQITQSDYLTI